MKMKSLIFSVVGLLGSVVIAPTACTAQESDRFFFRFPRLWKWATVGPTPL